LEDFKVGKKFELIYIYTLEKKMLQPFVKIHIGSKRFYKRDVALLQKNLKNQYTLPLNTNVAKKDAASAI